jgi:Ca2+-binding EF-hand superfamily protein
MGGALSLMLKKAEDKRQQDALQEAFKKADVNGDGRLNVDAYYTILHEHNIKCSKEEILNLIDIADKNKDGYISRAEFIEGRAQNQATVEKAERAFNLMDRNKDGFISKSEMLQTTKKLTGKQVEAVFERNDLDKDGKLSKEEFTEMMCNRGK